MRRTMVLIGIGLFLMNFFILNQFYVGLITLLILVGFTQKKHRVVMVILLLLAFFNITYQCQKTELYISTDKQLEQVNISPFKNDYILKNKSGYKILLKNDLNQDLDIGFYDISYEKNTYFYRNPHTFNYEHYLLSMGFVDVVNLSEVSLNLINKKTNLNSFKQKIYRWIDHRIDSSLKNDLTKGFVKSLILADKSDLPDTVMDSFMSNGTSHILAISGMHIGMFYLIFQLPFFLMRSYKYYAALFLVFIFLWLISWPYSGIRAFFLILGLFLSRKTKRPYDLLQTLSLIGIILMVMNPYIIYHTGFQYSFCALIIISTVYQHIFSNIKSKILSLMILSLTLQIALLPLTIYHQLEINILSFLINLLTIPLITLVVYISVFTVVLPLNLVINYLDLLIEIAVKINLFFEKLTFFKAELRPWPLWLILFFYFYLMLVDEKAYQKKILTIAFVLMISSMVYSALAIEVYFLDVGQGDSILIKHQNQVTLVDSGPFTEDDLLLEILKKNRVKKIDNIFISHSHADHIGGFSSLKALTTKSLWYYKSGNERDELFESLIMHKSYNTDFYEHIKLKGMLVTLIPYKSHKALNDASMVIKLEAYHLSFLFTGDIEESVESEIVSKLRPVDVLKVPHHGSKTSSTSEFVEKLNPKWAIICVGKNFYGHPHETVVENYLNRDVNLSLTRNGYVKFIILPFDLHFVFR